MEYNTYPPDGDLGTLVKGYWTLRIPKSIGELRELRRLDVRGNDLKELPKEILALDKLERLDLRWNENLKKPEWIISLSPECIKYF